jgi:pimeloyl-ACP methyl ester carboxylesterase
MEGEDCWDFWYILKSKTKRRRRIKKRLIILPLVIIFFLTLSCQKGEEAVGKKEIKPTITVDKAISADGVSIAYEVRGEGEPALVFVHGWCCDRNFWKEQLPYFSDKFKVVAIDLGGLGESGLGRTDWTLEAYGADVAAVVEKLNLDEVILIGHSMGGYVILEAERRLPQRVIGLVPVDVFRNVEEKRTQEYLNEVYTQFHSNFEKAIRDNFSDFADWGDPDLLEILFSCPPEVGLSSQRAYYEFVNNKLTQVLAEVQAPIMCINRESRPVDLEAVRKYKVSFGVKYISGVGHLLILEDPERFNHMLEDTIQEFVQMAESK